MMDDEATPRPTHADTRTRDLGKWLTGSGVLIACLLVVIGVLGLTIMRQVHIIDALVVGVSQQRDQFNACKDKPASSKGCTTPIAAEPSVIVQQGSRGLPGIPGATGAAGAQGSAGPQGPQGPQGPPGPIGKTGPPPGCALLTSGCMGATGPVGPQGPTGKQGPAGEDGKDGEDGAPGKNGADGATGATGPQGAQGPQGEMGPQGNAGRGIASTKCVNGQWVVTYTDGTQEDPQGVCSL